MIYIVQIVQSRIAQGDNGDGGFPAYVLDPRFSTIPRAERAGHAEIKRVHETGRWAFYNVLDSEGRSCGPVGRVE